MAKVLRCPFRNLGQRLLLHPGAALRHDPCCIPLLVFLDVADSKWPDQLSKALMRLRGHKNYIRIENSTMKNMVGRTYYHVVQARSKLAIGMNIMQTEDRV